ncbi:hypothetical protein pb186bvf_001442 [Paramecium bursaria]
MSLKKWGGSNIYKFFILIQMFMKYIQINSKKLQTPTFMVNACLE